MMELPPNSGILLGPCKANSRSQRPIVPMLFAGRLGIDIFRFNHSVGNADRYDGEYFLFYFQSYA
jgi:hypothetical protein